MNFNKHSELKGLHAFLGASKYHWVNYDEEKLARTFRNSMEAQRGTTLHELARLAIEQGVRLARSTKTLNQYVNDAIGFKMKPEQVLFYSVNCFGTADAISFKDDFLRIHDLKTGITATSMTQVKIYAAIFCLEYGFAPFEMDMELRIYQNDQVLVEIPESSEIKEIMDRIVIFDELIERLKSEET